MLFKVYDKVDRKWWAKDMLASQPKDEEDAYIFDTEDKDDMISFNEGPCFTKDDCVIKIVSNKGGE